MFTVSTKIVGSRLPSAYEMNLRYRQGAPIEDEAWVFPADSVAPRPKGLREYRQLLSALLNGLIDSGFTVLHMEEETGHQHEGPSGPRRHLLDQHDRPQPGTAVANHQRSACRLHIALAFPG